MYKFRQSAGYLSRSGSVGSNLIHNPANTWGLKDLRIKKSPNSKNHNYKTNILTKNQLKKFKKRMKCETVQTDKDVKRRMMCRIVQDGPNEKKNEMWSC